MFKTFLTGSCAILTCLMPMAVFADNAQTLPVQHVDNIAELEMPSRLIPKSWAGTSGSTSTLNNEVLHDETINTISQDDQQLENLSIEVSSQPVSTLDDSDSHLDTTDSNTTKNVADVEATVEDEIAEQTQGNPNETGQAVANPSSQINDDAIISIESRNGKTYLRTNLSYYAQQVNNAVWTQDMRKNSAMTVKLQTLLDWNHASPGPIDGGWGMNSIKALTNFQAMHNLEQTGRINQETWNALNSNIDSSVPIIVEYTLTDEDVNTNFAATPSGAAEKSKMSGLYYQNIQEMLAERFHMDVRYLAALNPGKSFRSGETITVVNVGEPLDKPIDRVIANKADETLYAYHGDQLVATYPTTVGSSSTPSPHGTYRIVNKVKMPWYRATVGEGDDAEVFMLPPGPNNPVGVVWMGLSKPSYGIHGSPIPEGISRQASHGCIRLTNWDVLEVYANINDGATVELL